MVAMDVQLDESATKFLLEQAKHFPNEVRRAFYYACGVSLRNMRSRMSGKSSKIAKWDDFTKRYRERAHWATARTFGGSLMFPNGRQLTMEPQGDRVRIGWIGPLEGAAVIFMRGGTEATTSSWRHDRYREGFQHGEVPRVSVTPERPVIDQVNEEASRHLADWTLGAFGKVMSGRIKSWELKYQRNSQTKMGAAAAGRVAKALGGIAMLQHYERVKRGDY